jgi:hypothetical protein
MVCAYGHRVVELRAEEDGDIHIALADATADKPGVVVPEIPAKPQWCQLRQIVFGLDRGPVSVLCELRSKTEDRSTTNYNNYGKTFSTSATLPQINQTWISKAMQPGRYIP